MAVTIYDIAKTCDVSAATVSRILNDAPNASFPLNTRKRVMDKAAELGYKSNKIARALVSGKTNQIALCGITELVPALSGCILGYVHDRVNELGFSLTLLDHKMGSNTPAVDGVMVWNNSKWLDAHIDSFAKDGIQVVGFGCEYNLWQHETDIISFVSKTAIAATLNNLVDSGRTKIAFFYGNKLSALEDIADSRLLTYRHVMASRNLEPRYLHFSGFGDRFSIIDEMHDIFRGEEIYDAIFCHNDIIAICAMTILAELGVNIPGQTAVVGFDGIEETAFTRVPLTTIKLPYEHGSRFAVDFLSKRIANPDCPRQYIALEAELIERESTGQQSAHLIDTPQGI